MKITYIHHSSFLLELETCTLLFDYFKGEIPNINKDKKLYVFASHSHSDHFNPSIFNLEKEYKNITYILSSDILTDKSENIIFVEPNTTINVDNLTIKTLESTDLGVAFIINVEGKNIYHAGDLNWWHWEGELSDEENKQMGDKYKAEISKIKNTNFDIAFIVLDSRQQNQYYLGFDEFMKNTNTKYAFPMHTFGDYSVINKLKNSTFAKNYAHKIFEINKDNQIFDI